MLGILTNGSSRMAYALAVSAIVLTGLIFVATTRSSADQSVFTADSDFDQGLLANVNYDVADQLQLNEGTTTILPFMWVANAGEDTVSKIDVNTGAELARYKTWFASPGALNAHGAWNGAAPSRTAVDSDGNVYVVNRTFWAAKPVIIKILATGGIDRNGNGVIDTSIDSDSSGTIAATEVLDVIDSNSNLILDIDDFADERIEWVSHVGDVNGVGRSLCLAPGADLWVGNYNTGNYYSINPATGVQTGGPHHVVGNPYGCAVDGDGILWGASLSSTMIKLDTNSPSSTDSFTHYGQNYGITTGNGKVYLGLITGNRTFAQFDPGSETFSYPAAPAVSNIAIGVGVASNGDIFASQRHGSGMWRFDPTGSQIWYGASPLNTDTRGAIVDSNGDVWSNHVGANIIRKYDGDTGAFVGSYPVGRHPYTYSDATGLAAASSTNPVGFWTLVKDTGLTDADWTLIDWASEELNGSSITVQARAANTVAGLDLENFITVTNGGDPALAGQFIEVKVRFDAGDSDESPILFDLSIEADTNDPPVADAGGPYDVAGGGSTTVDASGSSDPDGDSITYEWDLDNDGTFDTGPSIVPTATFDASTLVGPATVTVTVRVCDSSGACDTASVDVEILNNAPDCSTIVSSTDELWPANHKMIAVSFDGATDPDGHALNLSIDTVMQDEPVNSKGDGNSAPDAVVVDDSTVELRAERSGNKKVPGDGRVYHVVVSATDEHGASCAVPAELTIGVPHDKGKNSVIVDGGPIYDSTAP